MAQATLEEPKQAEKTRRMTWEEFLCLGDRNITHILGMGRRRGF